MINVAWERRYACGHTRIEATPGDPNDRHCNPGGEWVGAEALVRRSEAEALTEEDEDEMDP